MTESDDLIGSATSAIILGKSRRTFNRMVARGEISPAVITGENTAARLFRREDVEALLHAPVDAASVA